MLQLWTTTNACTAPASQHWNVQIFRGFIVISFFAVLSELGLLHKLICFMDQGATDFSDTSEAVPAPPQKRPAEDQVEGSPSQEMEGHSTNGQKAVVSRGRRRDKRRKTRNDNGQPQADRPKPPEKSGDDRDNFRPIQKDNEKFRNYLKALGLIPDDKWDEFWELLKEPLPNSFRLTGFKRDTEALRKVIEEHFIAALPEETAKLVQPIPWYPGKLAWQINMHRRHMRRNEELKDLRDFIINETASGNISRQETVSMLPPVLLDVLPGMTVLDMCAAPGSKTCQIVDMITTNYEDCGDGSPVFQDGLIVANDAELKRCHLLMHQIKRLQTPCVIVVNHDATLFPTLRDGDGNAISFDRVLADVPCSGDGTIRKNIDLWRTFHPNNALSLHPIQFRILKRGLELLKVGGRLVYSTCSMNPVENEAVICRMLNETGGTVRLVDCRDRLPELIRMPGMTSWKVMSGFGELFGSHTEVPDNIKMKIRPEFFPPPNVDKLGLEYCFRILPHFQNTGGFFVTVMEKTAPLPWQKTAVPTQVRVKSQKEWSDDPLVPFGQNDPESLKLVSEFFKFPPDFPSDQLFVRKNEQERSRHIYAVSKAVRGVLQNNSDVLRMVNAGVRVLTKLGVKDSACPYRLSQEGLQVWISHLKLPRIQLLKEELTELFARDYVDIKSLQPDVQESLQNVPNGSVIARYKKTAELDFELAAWKAATNIRCYVSKEERGHYMRLLQMENAPPRPPGNLI